MVTGIDIVRTQLRIAQGHPLPFTQAEVRLSGHSVECRINAENPRADFLPSPGKVVEWVPPQGEGIRVDTYVQPGTSIPPFYDSMVAKIIVHGANRSEALALMGRALAKLRVTGIATTTPLHQAIVTAPGFTDQPITTRWLEESFLPDWGHQS